MSYYDELAAKVGEHEAQVLSLAYYLHTRKPKVPDEICIKAARWILPHLIPNTTDSRGVDANVEARLQQPRPPPELLHRQRAKGRQGRMAGSVRDDESARTSGGEFMRFKVNYFNRNGSLSHSYEEGWEKTDYFCPCCAKQEVWNEQSGGDFYVGEQHLCAACGATFHLPSGAYPRADNKQDEQRLAALRDAARDSSTVTKEK